MPEDGLCILCVGCEPNLLEVRCAVLEQAGYRARMSTLEEAEMLLAVEPFDLLILSATVTDAQSDRLQHIAGGTPSIRLRGVTFPQELLQQVQTLRASSARRLRRTK